MTKHRKVIRSIGALKLKYPVEPQQDDDNHLEFCPICGDWIDARDLEAALKHMEEGHRAEGLRPMSEFDPERPAVLHYRLDDKMFECDPQRHSGDELRDWDTGMKEWEGLLLDGWKHIKKHIKTN